MRLVALTLNVGEPPLRPFLTAHLISAENLRLKELCDRELATSNCPNNAVSKLMSSIKVPKTRQHYRK
jgi:hypothetical protein